MLIHEPIAPAPPSRRWRLPTRLAFRLSIAYIALNLFDFIPDSVIAWVAAHVFQVRTPLAFAMNGSGDRSVDWIHAFCVLVGAVVVTAIWSVLDRKRDHYERLHPWLRLFVRFSLGSTMVGYGVVKVIPLQMPAPSLIRLLEPYGHFSPMGVLWSFIGSSSAYERFTGSAELLAGLLLFVPQTAMLGALVSLAVTTQIFVLNMTYDVPVKLFSLHLILYSLLLLAPDARRLANVLLLNRTAEPSSQRPLGRTPMRRRIWMAAQIGVGSMLVLGPLLSANVGWAQYGGGAPRSPLYGIWNVDEMSIDGVTQPALVTDRARWRRVVFDVPANAAFQRMDDTFAFRGATINEAERSLTLRIGAPGVAAGRLSFERPGPDELTLDGEMDGRRVRMQLRRFDHKTFVLLNRGFHWVQEFPFNR